MRFVFFRQPKYERNYPFTYIIHGFAFLSIILNSFITLPMYISDILCIFWILFTIILFKNIILSALSYFLITLLDYIIGITFIWIFELSYATAYSSRMFSLFVGLISLMLLVTVSTIFRNKTFNYSSKPDNIIGNIFFFGLITFILPIMKTVFESTNLHHRGQAMIGLVVVLLMLWAIYHRYTKIQKDKYRYQETVSLQDKLLKEQQHYYELLLEKETETRKFRHDIKQQLRCIYEYESHGEYAKSKEYIEDLLNQSESLGKTISTGNRIIDIVVSDIIHNKNIRLHWDNVIHFPLKLKETELCTLFANLLKNAVEAVEAIEEKDIWVTTKHLEEHFVIIVKNPIKEKVEIKKNLIPTTKDNTQYHGYGLQNVQDIVSKYNGNLMFDCDNHYFVVTIMLQDVIEN